MALSSGIKIKQLFFLKVPAMLIALIYLLNPIHSEISEALHQLSHNIVSPQNILSHSEIPVHGDHDEFHTYNSVHPQLQHQHVLINLINAILGSDSEQHNMEKMVPYPLLIDKHLPVVYARPTFWLNLPEKTVYTCNQKVLATGFLKSPLKPPI